MDSRAPSDAVGLPAIREALRAEVDVARIVRRRGRAVIGDGRLVATGRRVVVHVVESGDDAASLAARLERAATVAAALRHVGIVPLRGAGSTTDFVWYAEEFVPGQSLVRRLRARRKMPAGECLRLIQQLGSALQYAHQRGVAHGALTARAVRVDRNGSAHLAGLCVARAVMPDADPPVATAAEDQAALAALVAHCLTGRAPRHDDTFARVPADLREVLRRARAADPSVQYPTMLEFVAAFQRVAPGIDRVASRGAPTGAAQCVVPVDPPRRFARHVRAAAALLVAGVAGLGVVALRPPPVEPMPGPGAAAALTATTHVAAAPDTETLTALEPLPSPSPPAEAAAPRPSPARRPPAPRAHAAFHPTVPADNRPATLFVSSVPWGHLYVDGDSVGDTPRAGYALAPGTHTIRITRSGYQPWRRTIEVQPGEEVRLTGLSLDRQS